LPSTEKQSVVDRSLTLYEEFRWSLERSLRCQYLLAIRKAPHTTSRASALWHGVVIAVDITTDGVFVAFDKEKDVFDGSIPLTPRHADPVPLAPVLQVEDTDTLMIFLN
jgi:hypothetical protein